MGARNALSAYALYAGKIPPTSMLCLTYMALVSKDTDEHPWYSEGHAAVAVGALGRALPVSRADVKAVERAISPLLAAGAIVADRRASGKRRDGPQTARYLLKVRVTLFDRPPETGGRGEGVRPPETVGRTDGDRPLIFGGRTRGIVPRNPGASSPEIRDIVPRNPGHRPPETGGLRNRRRQEETQEEETADLRTDVTVPRRFKIRGIA